MSLPFATTSIPTRKSMLDIQFQLEVVGFERTAVITDRGHHAIMANFKGMNFNFEINPQNIVKALIDDRGERTQQEIRHKTARGKAYLMDFEEKAVQIGWRALYAQVKVVCDSIKLGVLDVADAFAGNLLIQTANGSMTLGNHFKIQADAGKLQSPGFFKPLGLPAPEGEKDNE